MGSLLIQNCCFFNVMFYSTIKWKWIFANLWNTWYGYALPSRATKTFWKRVPYRRAVSTFMINVSRIPQLNKIYYIIRRQIKWVYKRTIPQQISIQIPTSMTMRVASQPRKENMPSEHATEQRTIRTPANPTTDLAWIMFEEHAICSLPRVSDTYLGEKYSVICSAVYCTARKYMVSRKI